MSDKLLFCNSWISNVALSDANFSFHNSNDTEISSNPCLKLGHDLNIIKMISKVDSNVIYIFIWETDLDP